jgi:hypothetical protein
MRALLRLAGIPVRLAAYLLVHAIPCLVETEVFDEVMKDWEWVVTGVAAKDRVR